MDNPTNNQLYALESAQNTDRGKKRANNEDWVTGFEPTDPVEIRNSGSLYIVADGVGGASLGERASQYAADKVLFEFFQESGTPPAVRLEKAMRQACREINDYARNNNLSRMATTMVAANIRGNVLTVANVGDSRCYLIRSGKLVQITHDHNIAAELVRNGAITAEYAKTSRSSNTLSRSIGGDPDVDVDIFADIDLYPGDMLVLSSDGLTRYLENDDLLRLTADGTAEQISRHLVDFANAAGGADNTSVYVVKVGSEVGYRNVDEDKTIPVPIPLGSFQFQDMNHREKFSPVKKIGFSKAKIVNIVLAAILVLVAASGTYFLARSRQTSPENDAETIAAPAILPGEVTLTLPPPPKENPTSAPATPIPTEVAIVTEPVTAPVETATQPVQEPTGLPENRICIHVINTGTISTIFDRFCLKYLDYPEIIRHENCNLDERVCSDLPIPIEDRNIIQPGWFLFIPDVNDMESCEKVENSYWMKIKP